MNLNSILIGSDDPQRLVDYYTKLFGEPTWNDGGYTGWQHRHRRRQRRPPRPRSTARTRSRAGSSGTSRAADVQGDFDRFKAAGAIVIREPYTFERGARASIATLADPDDNYFQLMTPMPEAAA